MEQSRSWAILVAAGISTALALVLTALRLYVRLCIINMLDWDDLFNVLGMACEVAVMTLLVVAVQFGFGQHFEDLEPARATYAIELLRISEFLLISATVFVKLAICLLLIRILFLWTFIAFNTTTSMLDAALIWPQCTPVDYNWDKTIAGGHCWSDAAINSIGVMQGSIAAATDFTLASLPIYFLWEVRILWRIKLGICAIMALGFASGAFAIARTALVPSLTATHEPTYDLVPLFLWAVLESNFGVIAAAAPSVRPLLGDRSSISSRARSRASRSKSAACRTDFSKTGARKSWASMSPQKRTGRTPEDIGEAAGVGIGDEIRMLEILKEHDITA